MTIVCSRVICYLSNRKVSFAANHEETSMKKLIPLDYVLIAQFILFLILWTIDKNVDVERIKQINGIVFVVLFCTSTYLKLRKN